MRLSTPFRKRWALPVGAAAFASMLVLLAWFGFAGGWMNSQPQTFDSHIFNPMYDSVEGLSAASDVVVLGNVTRLAGEEVDYGASGEDRGYAVIFHELDVQEVLKGRAGSTIIVARGDPDQTTNEPLTALNVGETVVLFLVERTREDGITIESFDHFYLTVGFDNGVFDAVGEAGFRPRTPELFENATFSLVDIRALVK